jgi:hypothetical protein
MQRYGNQSNGGFHWPAPSADGYALNNTANEGYVITLHYHKF